MIKITKKSDIIKIDNIIVTLYGQPGVGKTTLALSAQRPILFDFDNGIQRASLRGDSLQIKSWADLASLTVEDLINYDTIIIDTVGRMLEVLALHLIKENAKLGRATGELTLQGYGALNAAFKAWLGKIKSFGKDIVLIGHAKESQKGDDTVVRIDAIGSSKDEIFKISDMLGYIEIINNTIVLNFNPTEKSLGKNCAGFDILKIPNIAENEKYLTDLIQQIKLHMNTLSAEQSEKLKIITDFKTELQNYNEPEDFVKLLGDKRFEQYPELRQMATIRSKELNFEYDSEKKTFYRVEIVLESDENVG